MWAGLPPAPLRHQRGTGGHRDRRREYLAVRSGSATWPRPAVAPRPTGGMSSPALGIRSPSASRWSRLRAGLGRGRPGRPVHIVDPQNVWSRRHDRGRVATVQHGARPVRRHRMDLRPVGLGAPLSGQRRAGHPTRLNVLFEQPGGIATSAADWAWYRNSAQPGAAIRDGRHAARRARSRPFARCGGLAHRAGLGHIAHHRLGVAVIPGMVVLDSVRVRVPSAGARLAAMHRVDRRRRGGPGRGADMDNMHAVRFGCSRSASPGCRGGSRARRGLVVNRTAATVYRFSAAGVLLGRVSACGRTVRLARIPVAHAGVNGPPGGVSSNA
jgi:hypothetical protein